MLIMISVVSEWEAQKAIEGGAGILDVKNPDEGSLGAQVPRIIRKICRTASRKIPVSAAIGDMPNLPGTASLAALGAACCGVDYVKLGLHGVTKEEDAITILREVKQAVRDHKTSVIAAGYADFRRAGTLDFEVLPEIARSAGVEGCLLDTAIKDGHSLFDFIDLQQLRRLTEGAHRLGLLFGVAGALTSALLPLLCQSGADLAGFRTAVCRDQRRSGPLDSALVRNLTDSCVSMAGAIRVPMVRPTAKSSRNRSG